MSNFELIIVDDCSTDNTASRIKAVKDSRIRYERLAHNSGACAARNRGIELADGEYIAFNDSDDVWYPEKLEKQLQTLKTQRADVTVCRMNCYQNGKLDHCFPKTSASGFLSYRDLLEYNAASTQLLTGKATCFKEIKFDVTMPRLQDWDIILRMALKYKIYYSAEILADTFLQQDSISTHPEKAVTAMERLYAKHKTAVISDPAILTSFLNKKASFVCRSGRNPLEETKAIYKNAPSAVSFFKYLLAQIHLYRPVYFLRTVIQSMSSKTSLITS
jgi:glycosyltransferase involved in cell wall biosynthesis